MGMIAVLTLTLIVGTALALLTVGASLGSLSCVWLGDLLGRRLVILIAACITIIGAILMSTSFSLAQFIVSRLVLGLGTGGCTATIPVWQSEISKVTKRGAHVVTEGIFIGGGIAIALWIDLGFYFIGNSSASWRVPFALEIVFLLVVVGFIFTLPESPRWLIKRDREQEARLVLGALGNHPVESPQVTAMVHDIQQSFQIEHTGSLWSIFSMGPSRNLHRTLIAAAAQMFFQISGVNMITFYATAIFQEKLAFGATNARVLAAAMTSCQVVGGLVAFWLIERAGRRQLMLSSAIGMAICMSVLAATTAYQDSQPALATAAVFLYLYNLIYPIGFLGLPLLYSAEVSPLHLRAAISGLANSVLWLSNFLVVEVTPVAFNNIGYRYYIVYAGINAAIAGVVYLCFPETTGLSLEEIDEVFRQSQGVLDPARIAKKRLAMTEMSAVSRSL